MLKNSKKHTYMRLGIILIAFLLLNTALFSRPAQAEQLLIQYGPSYTPDLYQAKTVITVNSGTDPDNNASRTCLTHSPCTLRRAIVQARNVPAIDRPVQIQFNIPATADEGYNSSLGIWKIHLLTTSDPSVLRRLNGSIHIDGSTQPGGRPNGPKIFLVGPGTGQRDGLIVGDVAGNDAHVIRGLGFQNFRTHIYLNTKNNLIENNWFGLHEDGTQPYLRNNSPQDGSGNAGIAFAAGSSGNEVVNNIFLGLNGVAAAVRGTDNLFSNNLIGTDHNGLTPGKQTIPDLICTPVDWLGGGGLSVADQRNTIENNVLAGLRLQVSQWSLQTDALRVSGKEHNLINNRIGLDSEDNEIGVCGRGIYLTDSPQDLLVEYNEIVDSGLSALSLNGVLYNGNTLRGNIIMKSSAWPQVDGNPKAEDAIQLGPSLPDPLEFFNPAKVTEINGTAVSGTHGDGNPCPNCTIELFLDNDDSISEALESLAVIQAGPDGSWSATLPFALAPDQRIRTTSTTAQYNTIPNMKAGTTSGLSILYPEMEDHEPEPPEMPGIPKIFFPMIIRR